MKEESNSSTKCLLMSIAKGMAVAAVLSVLVIVLLPDRGERKAVAAVEVEETAGKKEAEPRAANKRPVEFWMGDQRIDTREELDAARENRRNRTKDYYVAAYEGSEDFRRRQIEQERKQFDRDRVDDDLEEAALTEQEINRMERENVMIW